MPAALHFFFFFCFSAYSFPIRMASTAFWTWRRFSASSKISSACCSKTAEEISSPRWAGRQWCTVYVSLSEVSTYSPPSEGFGSRIVSAFADGWQNFVDGVQQLAVTLAGAWPVVVIAAAVAAGVVVWKKKKK